MNDVIAAPAPQHRFLTRYLQVVARPRTWLTVAWLLLGLPIGVATFTFAVTGFSLGLGLAITIVGIPLLVGMLFATRALAALDARLATLMLGTTMRQAPLASHADEPGVMARIGANLKDSLTWRGLLFMLLRMPLGIVTFTFAVTALSIVAALLAAPLTYDRACIELIALRADTPAEALACFIVGVLLLPAALHLLNGVGWVCGQIARVLLEETGARA